MKILVGYKRVVDYNVRIQVKPDGSGLIKLTKSPASDQNPAWGLLRPTTQAGR